MRTLGRVIRTLAALAIIGYVVYKIYGFLSKGGKFVGYDERDGISVNDITDKIKDAASKVKDTLIK